MGVAIKCILERELPEAPWMEGKSLAAAWCGENGRPDTDPSEPTADIITLDFGGPNAQSPAATEAGGESLLAPLDRFIAGDQGSEWHDASHGLVEVRKILEKLRKGATVSLAPDFEFFEADPEELTAGVTYDLEKLEEILTAAQRAKARFYLAVSV
jgi:hypothetical protein